MSNELYLHILTAGVITLIYGGLLELWKKSKEDYEATIKSGASQAFDGAVKCIQANPRKGDEIIDQFEREWSGYLKHTDMRYYIGKLIETNLS